jgi:transcriptional regulator with XRE-family HTH domain
MLFAEKIKQLREEKQMPQRKFAAALEIDTPMYNKIDLGHRRAKYEHIPVIAKLLQTDENMLVTLWIADKIIAAVGEEKELAKEALIAEKQKNS